MKKELLSYQDIICIMEIKFSQFKNNGVKMLGNLKYIGKIVEILAIQVKMLIENIPRCISPDGKNEIVHDCGSLDLGIRLHTWRLDANVRIRKTYVGNRKILNTYVY